MTAPARSSAAATAAAAVASLSVTAVLGGAAGAHFRWLPPFVGFQLFVLGLVAGGAASLALGLVALLRTRRASGRRGRPRAWLATLVGAALLGALGGLALPYRGVPPIHDLTTDPADPPGFGEATRLPANRGRDLTYPHGRPDTAALQRRAAADLAPIELAAPPAAAFAKARRAAEALGWTVVWANAELGRFEAFDESTIFRFVDDVAVRVRPGAAGSGAVVDVRSTSRVGISDLGANAERIRRFRAYLRR